MLASPITSGLLGRWASLSAAARSAGESASFSIHRRRSAIVASGRSAAGVSGASALLARASACFARTARLQCAFAFLAWVTPTREEGVAAAAGVLSVVATSATTLVTTAASSSARACGAPYEGWA